MTSNVPYEISGPFNQILIPSYYEDTDATLYSQHTSYSVDAHQHQDGLENEIIEQRATHLSSNSFQCVSSHSAPYTLDQPLCQWLGCNEVLPDRSVPSVRSHLNGPNVHQNVPLTEDGKLVCLWSGCGKHLLPTSLPKHIGNCHLDAGAAECPVCGTSLSTKDALKRHRENHCHKIIVGAFHSFSWWLHIVLDRMCLCAKSRRRIISFT